ncbi:oocyte zinc finger protein XlCOF6.1-like [Galleria mellonella]|uniref:Oocyte zinc finger protein XlCOF6.1-like n=1 Tax=Galleria mellonella TaxID=7137 RepID=A0A6J3C2N4_GALME|nr:oocyte zinc finger protein XlCOF6.1-like [Galleria mellonella]
MEVCRICLASAIDKDITELSTDDNGQIRNYAHIILFCFGIQIIQDSKMSTKLCSKCYKKILSFYKFKTLALRSDTYLRANIDSEIKNEIFLRDDIKSEIASLSGDEFLDDHKSDEVKDELFSKDDNNLKDLPSDDEYLSVIKKIKYEHIAEETKENDPFKRNKKKFKKLKGQEGKLQVCEECGKTVRNLKDHLHLHQPAAERKRIKCKLCDKTFSSHSARYKHNKIKHLGIKQRCTICNKFVVNVRSHQLVMHNSAALQHECVSCGRRFISQSALDVHMATHTKDRPFSCDLCEKSFRTKMVMLQHRRQVHEKEKSHLCQFCSKSFFKKYHLQIHLRSHTKEKPYECPDCGKCFSSTTILKNHRLIHTDIKLFACTHCDMTFCRSGYLRAHMVSHTKEKRYPCKYCGVKFGRSDHRKRHEHTAHERHLLAA